ncbi:hypothetical protein CesoFtcFv8_024691 [Champsocephalus esox]|uniref:Uncharacterized protein n=1 Tax=Champsocephalus esox TaxID=159716 RepID=A0AAN8GFB5_9TELE|nr:hypothetical protein CesoFtcFv8_024691 [Champsocephalus esox]
MLFRLQAVEAELQKQLQAPAAATPADRLHTEEAPLKQRSEGGADLETFPGGPSLQRAMHHLSRLKVLVEEPKEKPRGQKDEDEGLRGPWVSVALNPQAVWPSVLCPLGLLAVPSSSNITGLREAMVPEALTQ